MNSSTVVPRSPVAKFLEQPVNRRVVLPDNSLGIVRQYRETPQGRIYKVQGIDKNGHFRAYESISCWFSEAELRVQYFLASVDPEWIKKQAQPDTRNGAV
jgi:hypothetical protein